MAFRFMYLPSAGFLTVCAMGLYKAFNNNSIKQYSKNLSSMFYGTVILICIVCTVFLNDSFKSDYDVAYTLIVHYPRASRGYALMGQEYFKRNHFAIASEYFEKAILYGIGDPQVDYKLGICYIYLGELSKAKRHLLKVITVNPDFLDAHQLLEDIG
jgi:tetratricopeptide (TPR) repeat protein